MRLSPQQHAANILDINQDFEIRARNNTIEVHVHLPVGMGPFIYYVRTNFRISDPPTHPVRTDYDVTMTTIYWRTHGA